MIELLALPSWNTPAKTLDDWVAQLTLLGAKVVVERESTGVSWLEIASMRLRGYALNEGLRLEAINFELSDPDPTPAVRMLALAADSLGWEIHDDDGEDDDDD